MFFRTPSDEAPPLFRRLQRAEPAPPHVDRLLAHFVLSRHAGERTPIGVAQDGNHLLLGKC